MGGVMRDFWGEDFKEPVVHGPYHRFKVNFHYQKAKTDKMCGNCVHSQRWEYHNKYYWKCELIGFSHSTATDIRKSYVCDKHKKGE
jgi:hypothetical protein